MMCALIPIRSSCESAIVCLGISANSDQRRGNQRITVRAPSTQPALQRPNAPHTFVPQEQRHTGASGLVWSSTVKDYVAVPRQTIILLFQVFGVHAESTWNRMRISLEVHRMPQV